MRDSSFYESAIKSYAMDERGQVFVNFEDGAVIKLPLVQHLASIELENAMEMLHHCLQVLFPGRYKRIIKNLHKKSYEEWLIASEREQRITVSDFYSMGVPLETKPKPNFL